MDALALALKSLEEDPRTEETARRLVASIRASSDLHGMRTIAEAARLAETAAPAGLANRLRGLIEAVRAELSHQGADRLSVLVVSADTALVQALTPALESRARRVLTATSAQQARQLLGTQDVASMIVDSVLPGQDGRALVTALRSDPATAALPIVVIASRRAGGIQDEALVQASDGRFEKPVDAAEVADYLVHRLKRTFERGREARRDPLTGLLNRAAFCATYAGLVAQSVTPGEPLAVAILGINRFDALAEACGPVVRDDLIRQMGSALSASLRATDILARWGLSEFAVILPGEDHYGGTRALEKVLAALNRLKVETPGGKTMPVAVCAGLTVVTGHPPIDEVMERADHFLYAAYYVNAGAMSVSPIFSDATQPSGNTDRVAICLADPMMTRAMVPLLERDNFEVLSFASADDTLRELPRHRTSLIVLDDELPDEGAFRILQALRAQARFNRTPIVMLVTGEAGIVRALELGANDYAIKPFPTAAFIARVRRTLRHGAKDREQPETTVLIIDHEVPQLLVAGSALHQQGGCKVLLARGARDGLRRLTDVLPDVLILDLHLPDFPGSQFLKMIPLLPRLRKMTIIAGADNARAASLFTSDVFTIKGRVTRPYKPGTFLKEIRPLLSLPAARPDETPVDPEAIEAEIQRVLTLRT